MKRAAIIIGSMLVVALIAYLIARAWANPKQLPAPAEAPPLPTPDTKGATAIATGPVMEETAPPKTATVIPLPVAVTNRVTAGAGGKSYNTTLPAPYNTFPVSDMFAGGAAKPDETRYYMFVYAAGTQIFAFSTLYVDDAAALAHIASITPTSQTVKWVINQSGNVIKGSF